MVFDVTRSSAFGQEDLILGLKVKIVTRHPIRAIKVSGNSFKIHVKFWIFKSVKALESSSLTKSSVDRQYGKPLMKFFASIAWFCKTLES